MRRISLALMLSCACGGAWAAEPIKHLMLLPEVFAEFRVDEEGALSALKGGALGRPVMNGGPEVEKGIIRVRFGKMDDKDHMIMVIQNGYGRPLMYRAWLQRGADQPRSTSVCPVAAGLLVFEHWPYMFDKITVGDFHFIDEKADMTCR